MKSSSRDGIDRAGSRRYVVAALHAARHSQKGAFMRKMDEEPRGGSMLGCLMMMFVTVSTKIDSATANCICIALMGYLMWNYHTESRS